MRCAHIGFERSPQVFSNDTDPITATHTRPIFAKSRLWAGGTDPPPPHSFLAEGPRASRALSASRASSSPNSTGSSSAWPSPCRGRPSGRRGRTHYATMRACGLRPHAGRLQALVHARVPTGADQTKTRVKTRHLRRKRTPLATSGRFRRPNQPKTPQHAGVSPSRRSRQRTTPAENCPEVQDPWRSRRPFPAKPPEVAGRDRGQCHGSRKRRREHNMHGPNGGVG